MLARLARVGRRGDPTKLARIKPVHQAPFAGVDDEIARSSVQMSNHRLPACGTLEEPLTGILAAGQNSLDRAFFVRTNGVDDERESIHFDQHAETARATEQRMTLQPTRRERGGTDRAPIRGLAQQLQVLNCRRRLKLSATVVAQEQSLIAVDPH